MKKRIAGLMIAGVAVFALSGCGSSGNDYYAPPPGPAEITLFLLDEDGFSWGGVPYLCDGMATWGSTLPNGEFTFYEFESCTFNFIGFRGNWLNDPLDDDIVRVTDDLGIGIRNIEYDCASYGPDITGVDGEFYYDPDDECTFHFEGIY